MNQSVIDYLKEGISVEDVNSKEFAKEFINFNGITSGNLERDKMLKVERVMSFPFDLYVYCGLTDNGEIILERYEWDDITSNVLLVDFKNGIVRHELRRNNQLVKVIAEYLIKDILSREVYLEDFDNLTESLELGIEVINFYDSLISYLK